MVDIKDETPPFTHNLRHLAEETGIYNQFPEEHKQLINELMPLNIEARYPTYKDKLLESLTDKRCEELLKHTKQLRLWICKKLLKN